MNLSRIAARTAAEVCGRFDIGEEAKTLLRPERRERTTPAGTISGALEGEKQVPRRHAIPRIRPPETEGRLVGVSLRPRKRGERACSRLGRRSAGGGEVGFQPNGRKPACRHAGRADGRPGDGGGSGGVGGFRQRWEPRAGQHSASPAGGYTDGPGGLRSGTGRGCREGNGESIRQVPALPCDRDRSCQRDQPMGRPPLSRYLVVARSVPRSGG